jgi:hypothetical protein
MSCLVRSLLCVTVFALTGCTPTVSVRLTPTPQAPVCQPAAHAHVFWAPQWRPDQKDVPAREAAAAEGLRQFFTQPGCFASASVERLANPVPATIDARIASLPPQVATVLVLTVRELGPVLKIGSSYALVEGGTEVVLEVAEYRSRHDPPRTFTLEWRHGGPGTIKGVATLPEDMRSALAAGLQAPAH